MVSAHSHVYDGSFEINLKNMNSMKNKNLHVYLMSVTNLEKGRGKYFLRRAKHNTKIVFDNTEKMLRK